MKKVVKGFASVILASMIFVVGCKPTSSTSEPKITVTVAHDDNIAKVEPATLSVAKGSTWSAVKSRIKVTYKNGYGEKGWKDADDVDLTDDYRFEKDTTVFAVSKEAVTITVQGDDGIEIPAENTFTADKNAKWSDIKTTAKAKMSVKENYEFVEWRLNDKTGEVLTDDKAFEKDTTVYAVSKEVITITVQGDDGIEIPAENTFTVDKNTKWKDIKIAATAKISVKANYDLFEWRLSSETVGVLNDNTSFKENTTVFAVSKEKVTIAVKGDERIDLSSPLQIVKKYDTKWSDIKAEIETNIKPSADWKDDWNKGDYAVYEWRLGDEKGEKITDDYRFTENTTVYAVSNYAKWKFEFDYYARKVLSGVTGSMPRGKIIIPDNVERIEGSTFSGCSSLASITLSKNLISIGRYAFEGCSALTGITIPASVTSIEWEAFSGCSRLASITIPDGVRSIDESTFKGCSSLASITLSKDLISIRKYAFEGCSALTGITIPDDVERIGDSAFAGCSRLASITIPASVDTIGSMAFEGCSGLTSVRFAGVNSWDVYQDSNYTTKENRINGYDLKDESKAAELLTDTYEYLYWRRVK